MHIFRKKGWIFLTLIFSLLVILALTLPLQSNVTETVRFPTISNALFRQLVHDTTWHKWWPGKAEMVNQKLTFKQDNINYTVERVLSNAFELKASSDSQITNADLRLIPEANSYVTLTLATSISLPYNPIDRINALIFSSHLKTSYKKVLTALSDYYSLVKNLYGIDIKNSSVEVDYITTQAQTFSYYPSVKEIYSLIDQVKSYIKSQGGTEIGLPMLHISEVNSGQFITQVGVPTDKQLSDSKTMKTRRMLKGGHILTAQVVGDRQKIREAKKQMEFYIQDHNRVTVAISYEYLITNRIEQPDSSKWITELYFPIIQ